MMKHLGNALLCSLLFCSFTAGADIYKYTAPDGRIYYSDKPKHSSYKRLIRSKQYRKSAFRFRSGGLSFKHKNKIKFAPIIEKAANRHNLDPNLLHAVIHAESAYNPRAVSSAGAVGLMQLMPATAKQYGVKNRRDPVQNINGGAKYLSYLLSLFNSNTRLAVAAYNAGEGTVMKYKNRIPPYPETQRYVKRVMSLYHKS